MSEKYLIAYAFDNDEWGQGGPHWLMLPLNAQMRDFINNVVSATDAFLKALKDKKDSLSLCTFYSDGAIWLDNVLPLSLDPGIIANAEAIEADAEKEEGFYTVVFSDAAPETLVKKMNTDLETPMLAITNHGVMFFSVVLDGVEMSIAIDREYLMEAINAY